MSSAPTPPTPATAPTPAAGWNPLVESIRTNRVNAAYLLLGLAAVFLGVAVWLASKAERPAAAPPPAADAANPDAPPPPEVADPRKTDYRVGWIGAGLAALVCGGVGASLFARPARPTVEEQRTQARTLVLTVGGLLGALLIVLGGAYFYLWSESLTKWLDRGEAKEMRWVVIPFLMVVAGAGVVFAAIQPARADERNNQTLRRLVYGSNLALTVLLLSVALVAANVVISLKVQNKLDATETGFYTLGEGTKRLLAGLSEPVTAYVVMLDDDTRGTNDVKQLMYSAQDAAPPGKFTPKFVSPVSNKAEIQRLQEKYPKLTKGATGVLLAIGEEGGRHAFISEDDLIKQEPSMRPGDRGQLSFVGEAAIVRELNFLDQQEKKPVVYFTQSNGELSLSSGGGAAAAFGGAGREASQLKTFLERNYIDVKALELSGATPKVPDDATVVVVADPQSPLSEGAAKALKEYATTTSPARNGKHGKLVVAAGTGGGLAGLKDKRPPKTGLEGVLGEFGVKLGEQFIYTEPTRQIPVPAVASVAFPAAAQNNPIVQAIAPRVPVIPFLMPREVTTAGTPGGPFQVTPILITHPARHTWVEDEKLDDPFQTYEDLEDGRNASLRARKQYSGTPRNVGVVVAESAAPNPHMGGGGSGDGRAVVIGNGWIFSNEFASQFGGRGTTSTPPTFDLLSVSIDWLRGRPPLPPGLEGKRYEMYTFPQSEAISTTRLLYLPLGLAVIAVAGLGAGVWVMRRK
jgi:hypothetical protein